MQGLTLCNVRKLVKRNLFFQVNIGHLNTPAFEKVPIKGCVDSSYFKLSSTKSDDVNAKISWKDVMSLRTFNSLSSGISGRS